MNPLSYLVWLDLRCECRTKFSLGACGEVAWLGVGGGKNGEVGERKRPVLELLEVKVETGGTRGFSGCP